MKKKKAIKKKNRDVFPPEFLILDADARSKSNQCKIELIEDAMENHCDTFDRHWDKLNDLRRRVADLEARPITPHTAVYWPMPTPISRPSLWTRIKRWFI